MKHGINSRSVIIPRESLNDSTNYLLLFNVSHGTHVGYQSHKFVTSLKPQDIHCKIFPAHGWSFNTSFKSVVNSGNDADFSYTTKYKRKTSDLWTTKCSGKANTCNLGRFFASSEDLFIIESVVTNQDGDSSICYSNFTVHPKTEIIDSYDLQSKSSNFAKTGDFEEFNDAASLLVDLFVFDEVSII